MSTVILKDRIVKNASFYGCMLLVIWVIFKDVFRVSLFFGLPDFAFFFFFLGLLVSFIALLQGLSKVKLSIFDLTVVMYILYSSAVTLSHTIIYNPYSLTSYQVLVVLAFQLVSMLLLWFYALKDPDLLIGVTKLVAKYALICCVALASCLLVFVFVDLNLVFQFYSELMDLGVIVNPFQTSDDAIAVRFSGIFYSALNFGLFVVFCLIVVLGDNTNRHKGLVMFLVLVLLLLSSFNRNAMITFGFSSMAIILWRLGLQKVYVLMLMYLGLALIVGILIFIVNMESSIDRSDSFVLSAHSLYSRLEIWGYWLGTLDFRSLIYGHGVIAGMGDDHLYIDNGYVFLVVNSGIVSLLFLVYQMLHLAGKGAQLTSCGADVAFFLILGLPVAMIFNNVVLDPMLMLLFFFYPMALLNKAQIEEGNLVDG